MKLRLLWLTLWFVILPVSALADGFTFTTPEGQALARQLDDSYAALVDFRAATPVRPRTESLARINVAAIEQGFAQLPRTTPIEEVFEMRFAMAAWRAAVEKNISETLITFFLPLDWPAVRSPELNDRLLTLSAAFAELGKLKVLLAPEHLSTFSASLQFIPDTYRGTLHEELARLVVSSCVQFDEYTDDKSVKDRYLSRLRLSKEFLAEIDLLKGPCFAARQPGPKIVPCEWGKDEEELFSKWSKRPELAHHARSKNNPAAFVYRGVEFESGDVILIDQSVNYDTGMNTSFSIPRSLFSHMGVYVNLKNEKGEVFPAVVEIADKGLRAVPLSIYLAPSFSHYSEVHRRVNRPADYAAKVEAWATKKLREPFRYDFEVTEVGPESPNTVNCANEEALLSSQCGLAPVTSRSRVAEGILPTLKMLGFTNLVARGTYLTPTDYRRTPEMQLVGVLDNRAVDLSLAKELVSGSEHVEGSLGFTLTHYKLFEDRLPKMYTAKVVLVDQIKSGNWLAIKAAGFSGHEKNFPAAPTKGLAFVTTIGDEAKAAMKTLAQDIRAGGGEGGRAIRDSLLKLERFSVHEIENDVRVRRQIQGSLRTAESWFGPQDFE